MNSSRIMDPKVRETEGDGEDNSGKKKSKFKSFKKFFGKKKRKETSSGSSVLKLFQSTSDVAASHDMHVNYDSEDELETHKGIMGSRALSHDSIFIPETGQEPARPVRVFSQENISDRIRALQFSDSHKHLSSLSLAGTGSEEEEQRTQSESLTDLSCTPEEEEEDDEKEMQTDLPDAVFKPSSQELPCSTAAAQDVASWPKPRMPEDLPPALRPAMTQPTSESAVVQEAQLPENKPEDCQPTTFVKSESPLLLEGKDSATSSYSGPDREVQKQEDSSETPVLLSGEVSDVSVNIFNQENKELPTVFSVNKIPSEEDISISRNSIVCLEGSEENIQKDAQIPVEMAGNKEAKKEVALLSESSKQFSIGAFQPTDSVHVSHPAFSIQMGSSVSCSLEKTKAAQEAAASGKENGQPVVHKEELSEKKAEKAANGLNALRKFSVSSARERPRTRSLHFPERSELESPLNTGFFLSKAKVSSRNEKWKEDLQKGSDVEEEKSSNKKQTLLPGSDSENTGQPTEILAGCVSLAVDAVPVPRDSSVVSQNQPSCEDKTPFQVKLRSTSLSLKYRDNSSPESKEIKRYSAEFNLENEGLTSFLRGDKAQIKKTVDTNIGDSLNEKIKPKAKSSEQLSSKPPLPKKPALQNIPVPNTTANKEKQDKAIHPPESRNEDGDLEKKSNPCKVPGWAHILGPISVSSKCELKLITTLCHITMYVNNLSTERSVPSPMAAGDSGRDPDSPAEPAWISIARQKQRGVQQEQELDREKLVALDVKSDTEKQNKEKERTEDRNNSNSMHDMQYAGETAIAVIKLVITDMLQTSDAWETQNMSTVKHKDNNAVVLLNDSGEGPG
ncbi:hypothetical protein llap_9440 [Limosa lapponica baueri]|uniref:DUF4592 domain-containing protein n=1 Tax=Limosa lapponica baueri TaxID=1758121 RepID=A0A2I0U2F6_LIMLA|nr:hypothetical protein llap_9440 [Limosa lapponica baueri]